MHKKYNVFLTCFILVIIMCTACVKPITSNTANKSTTEHENVTNINSEVPTETIPETAIEGENAKETEPFSESETEISEKPTYEAVTELDTQSETQPSTQPAQKPAQDVIIQENATKPTKPQVQETTTSVSEIIYVPPYDCDDDYEMSTEAPTEPAPKIYTVKVNVYKEVNGVKSFVKTITATGEKKTLFDIPLVLPEDNRCKIAESADNITGVCLGKRRLSD